MQKEKETHPHITSAQGRTHCRLGLHERSSRGANSRRDAPRQQPSNLLRAPSAPCTALHTLACKEVSCKACTRIERWLPVVRHLAGHEISGARQMYNTVHTLYTLHCVLLSGASSSLSPRAPKLSCLCCALIGDELDGDVPCNPKSGLNMNMHEEKREERERAKKSGRRRSDRSVCNM